MKGTGGGAVIRIRDSAPGVLACGTNVRVDACSLPGHIQGHKIVFPGGFGTVESAFVTAAELTPLCYAVTVAATTTLAVFPTKFVHPRLTAPSSLFSLKV